MCPSIRLGLFSNEEIRARPEAAQRSLRETHGKPRKPTWPKIDQNMFEYVRLGLFSDEEIEARPEAAQTSPGTPREAHETRLAQD